jgi:hypothetical protein
MTVSSIASKISYAGNGVTTIFSFPYYFLANADLAVILRSSTGVETVQVLTTNYTVTGAGNPVGGTVTMLVAPASGETLVIYRDPALTQITDFVANDALPAETLEMALDRLTMISQRLKEVDVRSLKFPETDSASLSAVYPSSVDRASRVASFAADGSPTTLSLAGLGVTVDNTSLVVVAAVAPGHVNGRFWVDTSTANTLIVKQSDGVDWIELWRVDTTTNVMTIPNLAATVAQAVAGTDTAKFITSDALAGTYEKGTDIASAATLAIPATGGGYFHVTGTTGVTAISTSGIRSGTEITLTFDGVLTMTHSASLILEGGVNITTAAGDTYKFRLDGTNWRMVGDAKADGSAVASPQSIVDGAASRTLTIADNGRTFIFTNGGAVTVTLPAASTLPAGWSAGIVSAATGSVSVVRSSTDTIWSKNTSLTTLQLPSAGDGGRLVLDKANAKFYWNGKRSFTTGDTASTINLLTTTAHNLGVVPDYYKTYLVNVTGNLNYVTGDVVDPSGFASAAAAAGFSMIVDNTNINVYMGAAALAIPNKTTFATATITTANWNFRSHAIVWN